MSNTQKQETDPNKARLLAEIQEAEKALEKASKDLEKNTKEAKNFYKKVLTDENKIKKLSIKPDDLKKLLFNLYGSSLGLSMELTRCRVQLFSNRVTQLKWMNASCELWSESLSEAIAALMYQICAVKGQIPPDIKKKLESLQTNFKDVHISQSQVFIGQSKFSRSPVRQSQMQEKKWYDGLMSLSLGAIKKIFGL